MSLNNAHEGYDYQDLLTSYFILKEILLGNLNSIFSIDKKNTPTNIPDSFDDLVIINNTNIQRKQIKYSNDDIAKKLEKTDLANNSGYKLALFELYRTWNELNTSNSEFRLCLAWNEPTDDNIKRVLEQYSVESSFDNFSTKLYRINLDNLWEESPERFNRWNKLKDYIKDNNVDRNDFKRFCNSLVIELELPKASLKFNAPSDLENIVYQQAEKLGIGQYPNDDIYILDFLERLAKKVGEYRTRSAEVSGADVLRDLRVKTDFGKIEQKFEIDQSKNIKSDEKYTLFQTKIIENKKTLLIGEPGSGKSWFLTNFIEYLEANSQKVIRHYCFTDTEDELIEKRVSSDVFFGNLVADILKAFSQLKEVKDKLFVSNLDELNLLLSHVDEELIIIIDGLDHINRVLKNSSTLSENKTKIIEYISKIIVPDNVSVVLGSQPVSEIQILIDDFEYIDYRLPKWTIDDTLELMNKYALNDMTIEDKFLSEYLNEKSEGNPLYLTYIIKTLMNQDISIELINDLPQYDFNLKKYYEYLTSQMEDNLTSEILSCLDFSITVSELEKINPQSHHIQSDLKTLSPILNENFSRGGMRLYHDSFRRYNIEKLEENNGIQNIYKLITKWLNKQGFYKSDKAYRYLLSYYIKLDKFKKINRYATNDFLTKSLYHGYSEPIIKKNYDNFLYVANKSQDWALFVYISELNRTMQSTLSDSYNEFEERFELYFEAIGLVYGFERANSILYFDGKQNFRDELIVKAFYISQKNGYTPNWQKIKRYFNKKIRIEDFQLYLSYLIGTHQIDDFISKKINYLFTHKESSLLMIFIQEIYNASGIDKIIKAVDLIELEDKSTLLKNINDKLFSINAKESLFLEKKPHLELDKLTFDIFDDKSYEERRLGKIYKTLESYAYQDIEKLKEFNSKITPKTFIESWVQFTINVFIIEDDLSFGRISTYYEFEDKLINNFYSLNNSTERENIYHDARFIAVEPILRTFRYIKYKWKELIEVFSALESSPLGFAFIKLGLFDDFKSKENLPFLITKYENNLRKEKTSNEGYTFLIEDTFQLLSLYQLNNQPKKAKQQFKKIIEYTTAYTFRKDTTLNELIMPLESIRKLDNKSALKYTKKLLPLNLTIQSNSEDGKGIRWLYISWFEKFLKVNRQEATIFLINQFLKDSWFWKYEYMFIEYIQCNKDINPILLNFLYKLSPTNDKSSYINSFSDNIYKIIEIDKKLAKQSLINLLERDLNNHSEQLSDKSIKKLQVLKNLLDVSIPILESKKKKEIYSSYDKKRLDANINEKFLIDESLKTKSIDELIKYFDKRDRELDDKDLLFLVNYINEKKNEFITKKLLFSIIRKKHLAKKEYYENLRLLVKNINCSEEIKILLLISIFVFSTGGWLEIFVNKNALKDAVTINKSKALKYLANELEIKFKDIYYYAQSTSNLIIAFEYAGLKKKDILVMYQKGFESIEYRLPNKIDFDWKNIKDKTIKRMSNDEVAIVMILVRLRNLDTTIQKEIIFALNYLLNYDANLLIKPMKWFLKHIHNFPHLSIASILELFLLYVYDKQEFFQEIKDDIIMVGSLKNLYIQNSLNNLLNRIKDV